MDQMIVGVSKRAGIRLTLVDVTAATKTLEARHLCGPTAARVLGEALAGVALISADTTQPGESVALQLKVTGPVKGALVEATGEGHLRGYTHVKVLNDLDGETEIASAPALGDEAAMKVTKSVPGKILSQAQVAVRPADIRTAVARYFNVSVQTSTGVELAVRVDSAGTILVRGLTAQRMPDGASDAFVPILEAFEDGRIRTRLMESGDLPAFKEMLGLPDLEVRDTRRLFFKCRCSLERVTQVLLALGEAELGEIIASGKSQDVTCHMCGQTYTLPPEAIKALHAPGAS